MNSIKSTQNEVTPLNIETQGDLEKWSNEPKETKVKLATLMTSVLLSGILVAGEVQARPNMTEEQLAKAREVALQLKPPVDFDAMLIEAEGLGVECGDINLTLRPNVRTCINRIKIEQSKRRQAVLDEEILASQTRQVQIEAEMRQQLADLASEAEQKLNQ